jgi:hypothetical protein
VEQADFTETELLRAYVSRRESQCRAEQLAYGNWLAVLTPLRWSMVGSSTALSAIAGATIFARPPFIGYKWPLVAGICAFAASLLSALHAAFNCDAYQEECRRLVQTFYALEVSYQRVQVAATRDKAAQVAQIDSVFEEAIARAATSPPKWCRKVIRLTE